MSDLVGNPEDLFSRVVAQIVKLYTCSAEDIQVGNKGITGNMYSSGYSIDTNAITDIVNAL